MKPNLTLEIAILVSLRSGVTGHELRGPFREGPMGGEEGNVEGRDVL